MNRPATTIDMSYHQTPGIRGKLDGLISLKSFCILPVCLALVGCMSASKHQSQLGSTHDRALTLGTVQRDVTVGTSQADVAAALGSPNIVTGDNKREIWIYDKIASETSFSNDSGAVGSTISGVGSFPAAVAGDPSGSISGNVNGAYSKSAGATSLTQRTLTVIIKFTESKAVESVSYNSTRF